MTKLYHNSKLVEGRVREARGFFERMKGLIGRDRIKERAFLYFRKCNSIHTFFMKADIDVIMTDGRGVVRRVWHGLKPWRTAVCLSAADTLEMKAGTAAELGIRNGDTITIL